MRKRRRKRRRRRKRDEREEDRRRLESLREARNSKKVKDHSTTTRGPLALWSRITKSLSFHTPPPFLTFKNFCGFRKKGGIRN